MSKSTNAAGPTDPVPVTGELVDLPEAAVIPSEAEQNAGAERARGRTAIQLGVPAAIIVIATWLARLFGLDLDPGPGVDMPAEVVAAWGVILGLVFAFRMNPKT